MEIRKTLVEIDFLNKIIIQQAYGPDPKTGVVGPIEGGKKVPFSDELVQKFVNTFVPEFWNSDKDKIDYFQYFSDGTYFCQRKKLKQDFANNSSYWDTYQFKGATKEQAKELCDSMITFISVADQVKNLKVEKLVEEVDKEVLFYEQRYLKLKRQKNGLLGLSDWHVLPDVPEKYDGEKARWEQWRAHLRSDTLKNPDEFDSGLEYYRYTYEYKFPIDPDNYRKLYPNDMLEDGVTAAPAYMDVNDPEQWVKHDIEASGDFFQAREITMYNLARTKNKLEPKRIISDKILEMMKLLRVEEEVPVDYNIYYTEDA